MCVSPQKFASTVRCSCHILEPNSSINYKRQFLGSATFAFSERNDHTANDPACSDICAMNTLASEHCSGIAHLHTWTDVPNCVSLVDNPKLRHTTTTNYSSYHLTKQTHLAGLNDTLCRWLVTKKQNQLSQWSQSQIHLANHCENRLRLSVGRPYEKNRNKTTFFWRRQIPDDQEDAVPRELLHLTRTTRQVKHSQTQLRTKVLLIPWAVQMWAGWTLC